MARTKKSRAYAYLLLAIILSSTVIMATSFVMLSFTTYSGGWEVNTDVYGFEINKKLYTIEDISDFTEYREVGSQAWYGVDIDEIYYGYPDISIKVQDPTHVGWEYERIAPDQCLRTYRVEDPETGDIYYYDLHRFAFGIQIYTEGDLHKESGNYYPALGDHYSHEVPGTYGYPYNTVHDGKTWEGVFYFLFSIEPWAYRTLDSDNYTLSKVMAGVMGARVVPGYPEYDWSVDISKDKLLTDPQAGYFPSGNTPLNMYYLNGSSFASGSWEEYTALPDPKIPSKVLIAVSGWLKPGLAKSVNVGVVDPVVTLEICVEVLSVHKFTLHSSEFEPKPPEKPEKNATVLPTFWDFLGAALGSLGAFFSGDSLVGSIFIICISVLLIVIIYIKFYKPRGGGSRGRTRPAGSGGGGGGGGTGGGGGGTSGGGGGGTSGSGGGTSGAVAGVIPTNMSFHVYTGGGRGGKTNWTAIFLLMIIYISVLIALVFVGEYLLLILAMLPLFLIIFWKLGLFNKLRGGRS